MTIILPWIDYQTPHNIFTLLFAGSLGFVYDVAILRLIIALTAHLNENIGKESL